MKKNEAIEKISALLSRIHGLEQQKSFSEDFKKWQHDVRAALKYAFPKEKSYVDDFNEISYSLSIATDRTPSSAWEEAFRSGLGSARAMLQSRIDEITQFWQDEEPLTGNPRTLPDSARTGRAFVPSPSKDRVFVIHGRQLLGDFHTFLRSIGLKPLEWSNARTLTGKPTPYTWEIVDIALREAGAIVGLFTPDDEARLQQHLWSDSDNSLEKQYLSQPRQNVLFEAGVAYGRQPERTVLVRVGSHRPMSDLAGHHIIQLDDSPQSRCSVADALRTAGCPVDLSGSDWLTAGVFSLPEGIRIQPAMPLPVREDAAKLALFKTHLKGFNNLIDAAGVVANIHSFFFKHPIYLNAASHAFLEKYPLDFRDQATLNTSVAIRKWPLDELKRDVDTLTIDSNEA